jgi:hypothetical protein
MADVKISQLPLFTGNTSGSFLVMNNSGETTTYKVKIENALNSFFVQQDSTIFNPGYKLTLLTTGSLNNRGRGDRYDNTSYGEVSLVNNKDQFTVGGGIGNTAIGYYTLYANTSGSNNTAVGTSVLKRNTIGYENTAVGGYSQLYNETGNENTSIGLFSSYTNVSGSFNTSVGYGSLYNNKTSANTAVGFNSLQANTIGSLNTAVGHFTLVNNTTGEVNTGLGATALQSNKIGSGNVAIGYDSQWHNQSGSNNIGIGNTSLYLNVSGSRNIAIGDNAGRFETGNGNFYLEGYANFRSDNNAMRSGSLMWGQMASSPASQTLQINAKTNIKNIINLSPQSPLPSGVIGDLAVSGSGLYFYNGAWTLIS